MPKLGINQKIIQQQKLLQMNIQKRLVRIWQPNQKQVKFWGGTGSNQYVKEQSMPNAYSANPVPKTSYTLAEEYGVNPSTIQRDAQFSQVVDILPEEAKHNVLSGKENITRNEARVQNEPQPKTYDVIAEEYSVSPSTIKRNANFAKVVDILSEEVKHDVLSGEEKISRVTTDIILDFDKPTQKKFLKEVESGTPIKEAVKNTWL